MKRCMLMLIVLVSINTGVQAQVTSPSRANWWGNTEGMLNRKMEHTLEVLSAVLKENPPGRFESKSRRLALLALDEILHDTAADKRPTLHKFFHKRMLDAARQMTEIKPEGGAKIWKLYNHSFVVKTATVTMAFDMVGGSSSKIRGFALSDSVIQKLVDACDVLFVSHFHDDHADERVARAFLLSGKPVIAPSGLWETVKGVRHLQRDEHRIHSIRLKNKEVLQVNVWPGHQGTSILNNIYIVTTPEHLRFAHTGDQSNADDLSKLEHTKSDRSVDALFVNCWTGNIARLISAFNPKILMSGHENELGHSLDHREPYWLSHERLKAYKNLLMTWGESVDYKSYEK